MGDSGVVFVVTGGDEPGAAELASLPPPIAVVAADSGILHAWALGLRVDVAIGDFDSVTPEHLDAVEAAGGRVERHPRAKERTDVELALLAALEWRPQGILLLGGHGGRLDHFLANVASLTGDDFAGVDVEARMGPARLRVVRPSRPAGLRGEPGELVSLLAYGGPAVGVVTSGLAYPLHREVLGPGSTRGISNEFVASDATVALETGVLLVVQPGVDHIPTRSEEPTT